MGAAWPVRRESCGTPAGYKAHLRAGELACRRCLAAQSQDGTDRALAPRRRAELAVALSKRGPR